LATYNIVTFTSFLPSQARLDFPIPVKTIRLHQSLFQFICTFCTDVAVVQLWTVQAGILIQFPAQPESLLSKPSNWICARSTFSTLRTDGYIRSRRTQEHR